MSDYVTKTNLLSALGRFKENTDNLYGTKAEASDLKSAIDANSKRITNLEQKAGDEIVVDYPSQTYGMDEVPANVAEYGKVTKLRGVTRAWNQKMPIVSSFSRSSSGVTYVSDGNGKYSISGLASANSETRVTDALVFPKGHRFLIATTKPMSYGTARIIIWVNNSQTAGVYYGGQWESISETAKLFTIDDSWNNETIWFNVPNGKNPSISDLQIMIRDLTQYFSSDPSVDVSTLTISDIQTNYPELLIPSDYDAGSLVSTTYGAVKSKGVNLWDEEAQVGNIDFDNTGNDITDSTRLRSGYIPCLPSTAYYCKFPITDVRFGFYDMDEHYLGSATKIENVGNTSFTTPSGAYFMRFRLASSYGVTYNHDIQICLNSYADKTTYHPYMTDTLTLPSPVTLRSAVSVADTDELNVEVDGVGRRRQTVRTVVERYTGAEDWREYTQAGANTVGVQLGLSIYGGGRQNIINNLGIPTQNTPSGSVIYGITQVQNVIFVTFPATLFADVNAWKTYLSTHNLVLCREIADPVVTLLDPILDPFIQVEGGGTIRPIQTQTTEIDSAMTAEYLSLGA